MLVCEWYYILHDDEWFTVIVIEHEVSQLVSMTQVDGTAFHVISVVETASENRHRKEEQSVSFSFSIRPPPHQRRREMANSNENCYCPQSV